MNKEADGEHNLTPGSRLRRVEGIAWRKIEEQAVLVNVRSDDVMHLNTVASFLWSNLDGVLTLAEIAQAITGEYNVDEETALSDALAFAGRLLEQGAAELVELEK